MPRLCPGREAAAAGGVCGGEGVASLRSPPGTHRPPLCSAPQALGSPCPAVCQCPAAVPQCAPGVGLVPDGCGCCKVCAKQLNEDCSRAQPCDHTKGLECNFGASAAALKGICRGKRLALRLPREKTLVPVVPKFSNFESMYGYALLLVAWQKGT